MDERRAIPRSRHLLFWSIAAIGCTVDLLTKHWMFSLPSLRGGEVWWLWTGHAGFQLSLNEGALFGMGQGKSWVFAACSAAAAIAIPVWLFAFGGARDRALTAVLGCILGGVLGNLYDRTGLPGLDWGMFDPSRAGETVHAVRDFVLVAWHWPPRPDSYDVWPNFNVADSLLVCGAASLFILSLRRPTEPSVTATAPVEQKSTA